VRTETELSASPPPPTSRLYPAAPQAKHPKIVELIQAGRGREAGYAFEREREKR